MNFSKYLILLFCFTQQILFSQNVFHDFSFQKNFDITVKNENGIPLKYAWVGGLNSCQFSEIDLNNDGIKDLFVFDRHGNKVLTFLNKGIKDSIDYVYVPEYEKYFPPMQNWVQLWDFNHDGKEDIFTYTNGGIAVYKNVSTTPNELKFTLFKPLINSQQGRILANLLVTSVDYPGIVDIDNDGDLDILTFFGLGSFVQYHKNMSFEKYGNYDSLTYVMKSSNWGNFAESPVSNQLTLDTVFYFYNRPTKHTGSTFLVLNLNNDLVLGDVGYPNLIKLTNGGNKDSCYFISQDTAFPSNSKPVHLYSFPLACLIDVNNDGVKDLLVSSFEPGLEIAENKNSIWYYKNSGSNDVPVFNYSKSNFLQEDMIDNGSGAYPVLYDYNHDGLLDLFVSNYGYFDSAWYDQGFLDSRFISKISLYENTGTLSKPEFTLVTDDFAGLSSFNQTGLYPTFGDINHDGKNEMLVGRADGRIMYFSNISNGKNPDEFVLADSAFQKIDVGQFSTPQLFDMNNDSLLDLVIGERGGKLHYFENTGSSANPIFTLKNDSLGNVDVTNYNISWTGYSVPCFFKNKKNKLVLFTGSETGDIGYYKNIENKLDSSFTLVEMQLLSIYEGIRSAVAVGDLDNDGIPDMIVGNYRGGLSFYKGDSSLIFDNIKQYIQDTFLLNVYPNPANQNVILSLKDASKNNTKANISLIDIYGEIVFKESVESYETITLQTSSFANGLYFVKIDLTENNKSKMITRKLLINH